VQDGLAEVVRPPQARLGDAQVGGAGAVLQRDGGLDGALAGRREPHSDRQLAAGGEALGLDAHGDERPAVVWLELEHIDRRS
jgi:hypothetical protein